MEEWRFFRWLSTEVEVFVDLVRPPPLVVSTLSGTIFLSTTEVDSGSFPRRWREGSEGGRLTIVVVRGWDGPRGGPIVVTVRAFV